VAALWSCLLLPALLPASLAQPSEGVKPEEEVA
jgi:hypothetical protein